MLDVVILSAARTPLGSFLGGLSGCSAPQLGAVALRACLSRAQLDPTLVDQVVLGQVLQAGCGQAPARQAALAAEVPEQAGATTVNKVCGSGLRSLMDATNGIRGGEWDTVLAGGMESMSNAPHLLLGSRRGSRMGPLSLTDAMLHDGLTDPYSGQAMGQCAELCARKYNFSRAQQDDFARQSYQRAQAAVQGGHFAAEIAAVAVPQRKGADVQVSADEEPFAAPLDKMGQLRPAFDPAGSITAANASKLSDGAAALLLMAAQKAEDTGKTPLGRVVAQASAAQAPQWFTTAPAKAAALACRRAGLPPSAIDLWEINEAFAVVTMAAIVDLQLDAQRVNCHGGALALGHPIGASGARLLTTLLYSLMAAKKRYGCACLCIGGGEAVAMVIENLTL